MEKQKRNYWIEPEWFSGSPQAWNWWAPSPPVFNIRFGKGYFNAADFQKKIRYDSLNAWKKPMCVGKKILSQGFWAMSSQAGSPTVWILEAPTAPWTRLVPVHWAQWKWRSAIWMNTVPTWWSLEEWIPTIPPSCTCVSVKHRHLLRMWKWNPSMPTPKESWSGKVSGWSSWNAWKTPKETETEFTRWSGELGLPAMVVLKASTPRVHQVRQKPYEEPIRMLVLSLRV